MSKQEHPCRHCKSPKRHAYCHSNCEKLKAWEADTQVERQVISNNRRADRDMYGYFAHSAARIKKMKRKKG